MKASEFCYWLQGFFELRAAGHKPEQLTYEKELELIKSGYKIGTLPRRPSEAITAEQAEMIERHLALVFMHELDTAQVQNHMINTGLCNPAAIAEHMQTIHDGKKPQIGGTAPNGDVYRC